MSERAFLETARRRLSATLAALALSGLAVAPALAGEGEEPAAEAAETMAAADGPAVADWVNPLGRELLAVLFAEAGADANILVSPLSLATALTMTALGASGTTAAEYAGVLGYDDPETAAKGLGALASELERSGEAMVFRMANGLWLAPDLGLRPDFAAAQTERFGAEISQTDFSDPGTVDRLNAWFAEATEGMIPDLFDRLPEDTRIVLGNALYMKGGWLDPFDPEATEPGPFHLASGDVREAAMMRHARIALLHRETAAHSAVLLPFADPDFELLLALPAEGGSPEALLAEPEFLDMAGFRIREGRLVLPRLDLDLGGDITAALKALGLFATQDYALLAEEPLEIAQVVHRTALRLDEAGAEAAAATGVVGVRSSAPAASFDLVFDRPFLLGLRHVPSGSFLFLGRIGAP